MTLNQEVQEMLQAFETYYFKKNLQARIRKEEFPQISFSDFTKEKGYEVFTSQLEQQAYKEKKTLNSLLLGYMTPGQEQKIGALFYEEEATKKSLERQSDLLDMKIGTAREVQDFSKIMSYLNEEDAERFSLKLAALMYGKLDERERKILTISSIKSYVLNIGFIRFSRVSHREAINFVKEYPSLFSGEDDVLDSIVERYVDEELITTPIDQTEEKINELEKELIKLYSGEKNES